MDTKKLRQKILDLAIRGKLVPQDPKDEPASVLLERIRAEKEHLIKEGKIKRSKKSVPNSTEFETPFEIPESWMWTTVGEIASSILYGVSESAKESGNYKLLRITDIQNNKVNWETVPYTNYDENKAQPYLLRDGDILFARTGATVGKSYLAEGLLQPSIYASYLIRVQTSNVILPSYIKLFFESGYYWEQITLSSVGIGQPNVNGTTLAALSVPIPPYQEQQRIANEVNRWFAVIDALESNEGDLLKAIDHAKSKILDLAIHGKLVPQDPNDEPAIELLKRINPKFEPCDNEDCPFEIPKSWVWITIDDVCEVARGGSPRPIKDYLTDAADGINWIKIGDTEKNGKYINSAKERIKPEGKNKSRYVHKGDFLLTNSMSFGHPYILNINGCIHDGWLVISPLENAFDTDFLYHLLSSVFVYDQFSEAASGGVVSNLNSEKVAKTIVPLPPYSEQLRIVTKIEELFAVLDGIKESLE